MTSDEQELYNKILANTFDPNENNCSLWSNKRTNNGYPEISHHNKIINVTNWLYKLWYQKEPKNNRVYKLCKEKLCLTKEHMTDLSKAERDELKKVDKKEKDSALERFHKKYSISPNIATDMSSPCWLWTGEKNSDGYGNFHYEGKKVKAHRWSCQHLKRKGESIPDGYVVRHLCNETSCVNPDHLEIGTPQDNVDDMMKANRHKCSPTSPLRKIPKGGALAIRLKYEEGLQPNKHPKHDIRSLAQEYGVRPYVINSILYGNSYKEEGGPIFKDKKKIGELPPPVVGGGGG